MMDKENDTHTKCRSCTYCMPQLGATAFGQHMRQTIPTAAPYADWTGDLVFTQHFMCLIKKNMLRQHICRLREKSDVLIFGAATADLLMLRQRFHPRLEPLPVMAISKVLVMMPLPSSVVAITMSF